VLNALRTKLVDPELFAHFCEVFTREMNRLRMEGRAEIASTEAEIAKIDRELETLLNLILKGGAADALNAKMVTLKKRNKELELFLAEAATPAAPKHGTAIPQAGPNSFTRPCRTKTRVSGSRPPTRCARSWIRSC